MICQYQTESSGAHSSKSCRRVSGALWQVEVGPEWNTSTLLCGPGAKDGTPFSKGWGPTNRPGSQVIDWHLCCDARESPLPTCLWNYNPPSAASTVLPTVVA